METEQTVNRQSVPSTEITHGIGETQLQEETFASECNFRKPIAVLTMLASAVWAAGCNDSKPDSPSVDSRVIAENVEGVIEHLPTRTSVDQMSEIEINSEIEPLLSSNTLPAVQTPVFNLREALTPSLEKAEEQAIEPSETERVSLSESDKESITQAYYLELVKSVNVRFAGEILRYAGKQADREVEQKAGTEHAIDNQGYDLALRRYGKELVQGLHLIDGTAKHGIALPSDAIEKVLRITNAEDGPIKICEKISETLVFIHNNSRVLKSDKAYGAPSDDVARIIYKAAPGKSPVLDLTAFKNGKVQRVKKWNTAYKDAKETLDSAIKKYEGLVEYHKSNIGQRTTQITTYLHSAWFLTRSEKIRFRDSYRRKIYDTWRNSIKERDRVLNNKGKGKSDIDLNSIKSLRKSLGGTTGQLKAAKSRGSRALREAGSIKSTMEKLNSTSRSEKEKMQKEIKALEKHSNWGWGGRPSGSLTQLLKNLREYGKHYSTKRCIWRCKDSDIKDGPGVGWFKVKKEQQRYTTKNDKGQTVYRERSGMALDEATAKGWVKWLKANKYDTDSKRFRSLKDFEATENPKYKPHYGGPPKNTQKLGIKF